MFVKSTSCAARLKNYLRMLMQQQSWILLKKPVFTILYSVICLSFFTVAIILLFYLLIIRSYNLILVVLYNFNYIFSSPTSNCIASLCWCAIKKLLTHSLLLRTPVLRGLWRRRLAFSHRVITAITTLRRLDCSLLLSVLLLTPVLRGLWWRRPNYYNYTLKT